MNRHVKQHAVRLFLNIYSNKARFFTISIEEKILDYTCPKEGILLLLLLLLFCFLLFDVVAVVAWECCFFALKKLHLDDQTPL